jgi:hypothetical protein
MQRRITTTDWDLYDTRHAVFTPAQMTAKQLEHGYWRAYRDFYRWGAIARGPGPTATSCPACGTPPTPPDGRNSSRCGIW